MILLSTPQHRHRKILRLRNRPLHTFHRIKCTATRRNDKLPWHRSGTGSRQTNTHYYLICPSSRFYIPEFIPHKTNKFEHAYLSTRTHAQCIHYGRPPETIYVGATVSRPRDEKEHYICIHIGMCVYVGTLDAPSVRCGWMMPPVANRSKETMNDIHSLATASASALIQRHSILCAWQTYRNSDDTMMMIIIVERGEWTASSNANNTTHDNTNNDR